MLDNIQELELAEKGDTSFLTPEYQDILKDATNIENEYKSSPSHIEFLRGIIISLFSDASKLRGKALTKLNQLKDILSENYDFEKLLSLFQQKSK